MLAEIRRARLDDPIDVRNDPIRQRAYLVAKIRKYTVYPAGKPTSHAPARIVLAQFGDSLEAAFELAHETLVRGDAVRIIAPGITLRRTWPAWVHEATKLALTEWGAFTPESLADATSGVESEIRVWVRDLLGADFGGIPSEKLFFAGACQRFLQRVLIAYPVARGIANAFPEASIGSVRRDALTADLIRQFVEKEEPSASRSLRLQMRLRVACLAIPAVGAAVARATRDYVAARPTFRAIRKHRGATVGMAPTVLVGILPDWYRMNHHLLDAFALPETREGDALGVVFVGSLAPYRRDEQQMRAHHSSELWPGLGQLRERLSRCTVEQAVMPESPLAFVRAVGIGAARAAMAIARFVRSPELRLPSLHVLPRARDVVPWLTMDVVRATLGDQAGRDLLRRTRSLPTTVVFTGSNNISWSPFDYALQAAGVMTVDHPHGSGSDVWTGMCDSASSVRVVWTSADAASAAAPGVRTVVTGMPVRFHHDPRTRPVRRILITSGYVHRDAEGVFGFPGASNPFPHRVFQAEILDVARLLRERGHASLEFRWRPHPADIEAALRDDFAKLTDVELSRGRTLEQDAGWADVVVSSVSTVVIENLFAGVPIFVQVLPESDGLPSTGYLMPERVFFHAEDGASLVSAWIARFGADPQHGLEPEAQSRRKLFGETGAPIPMTEYFGRRATRLIDGLGDHGPQRTVT